MRLRGSFMPEVLHRHSPTGMGAVETSRLKVVLDQGARQPIVCDASANGRPQRKDELAVRGIALRNRRVQDGM